MTFIPDSDGTVRYIPLLARSGEKVYPQFAAAVAADELVRQCGGTCHWSADGDTVRLTMGQKTVEIPVDRGGMLLINWVCGPGGQSPVEHIPAGGLVRVWKARDIDSQVQRLKRAYQQQLATKLTSWKLLKLFQRVASLRVTRQQESLYGKTTGGDQSGERDMDDDLMRSLDSATDRQMEEAIDGQVEQFADPAMATDKADKDIIDAYHRRITALSAMATRDSLQLQADLDRLRKKVSGKICLIGSSSTGAADFVPTPMGPRVPGVQVHANIINTILTGQFVPPDPAVAGLPGDPAGGALVTLVSATRPVITQAAPAALALAAALVAVGCFVVFGMWSRWLGLAAPVAAMGASFVAVTAYRQLTEERAKKHIRGMFAPRAFAGAGGPAHRGPLDDGARSSRADLLLQRFAGLHADGRAAGRAGDGAAAAAIFRPRSRRSSRTGAAGI